MARRKKADTSESYTARLEVQLTPTQRRSLEAAAARADVSLSHYARVRLMREGAEPALPNRDAKALRELAAEVARIGNNLNQIARVANATEAIKSAEQVEDVTGQLAAVFGKIITL